MFSHVSVLPAEVIQYLQPRSGGIYVDGTVGGGGHAKLILEASAPDGVLVGLDRDEEALAASAEYLAPYGDRVKLLKANFADIAEALASINIAEVDGILLDVGVSSHQLDTDYRGFSFLAKAPLDMRMDRSAGKTAADLINDLSQEELTQIIREYGEERWAARIASRIVELREREPIENTLQLADVVKGSIPRAKWEERIHPATRTFQAFRIAVNDELQNLESGMAKGFGCLKKGGRIVLISFHSLEDRLVKNYLRGLAQGCVCPRQIPVCVCQNKPKVKILTGKPITAVAEEIALNPRSRSAKLRAGEKL